MLFCKTADDVILQMKQTPQHQDTFCVNLQVHRIVASLQAQARSRQHSSSSANVVIYLASKVVVLLQVSLVVVAAAVEEQLAAL